MARVRCVLVGVDRYERPEIPPLSGCVNDIALVRQILRECFGVPNEDIRVLVNERATKANIVHRLRQAVRDAEEGDVVGFYFSGHGSQLRDRNGDELTDSLDEVICPYDMDWDRGTYILDDDLDALFAEIRPGVLLEAFFDCCFWGASPRQLEPEPRRALRPDVRFLRPPPDIAFRAEGEEEQLHYHSFHGCNCFEERNALWAASQEGQPAAEDIVEGRGQGIFTYAGCRFIETNAQRIWAGHYSREQLLQDLRAYMRSLGYVQSAELTAPSDLRRAGLFMRADEAELPGRPRRSGVGWTRRTRLR